MVVLKINVIKGLSRWGIVFLTGGILAGPMCGVVKGAEVSAPAVPSASMRIQPMDKLRFRVVEDPVKGEPEQVMVSPNFMVDFPVSHGSVVRVSLSARDKTLEEISRELKARLDADYYVDAHVEIAFEQRSLKAGRVLISGAARVNILPLDPSEQKTILEAILQAQPTDFAKLTKVKLFRSNPATGKLETRVIDVDEIKKSGDKSKDVILQDGDRIDIPEKGLVF